MGRWALVIGICAISALSACSRPVVRPVVSSLPAEVRAGAAANLVREGCLDCLLDAYQSYEPLLNDPVIGDDVTAAAVRAAALIAIRERELGLIDSGLLVEARALADSLPGLASSLTPLFEIIETLGAGGQVTSDAQMAAAAAAARNRTAWTEMLRLRADESELTAYLWMAFNCTYNRLLPADADALLDQVPTWRETPLIAFRLASCAGTRMPLFDRLLDADQRFVEITYFKGLQALLSGDLDAADAEFARANAWRSRWPVVALMRANLSMTAEDYDRAVDFYDRVLASKSDHAEAMLGRARALTYSGRYSEALAAVDALLTPERWFVGDARYLRATNELQLDRVDDAWDDIERAARLITNADVPKLAGVIALRREQLTVARSKFEEAHQRNMMDCETLFHLGTVLAEQREWRLVVDRLVEAAECLNRWQEATEAEIARIRASNAPDDRKARQIARREQQLAAQARMRATSWFDIAAACFNLARYAEAAEYAERVIDDAQFGDRARQLLARVPPSR